MKTVIKKTKLNQYVLTPDRMWVRDLSVPSGLDINNLLTESEYSLMAANEALNLPYRMASISAERLFWPKVVIVSDGYEMTEKVKVLSSLKGVTIIGVNGSMLKWPAGQKMDFYVINNPYPESMTFLPRQVKSPKVILSSRTYPPLVKSLVSRGLVLYRYCPTPTKRFGGTSSYTVDDYRNPICAAISLAHRFGARKIALMGCDDSFSGERAGSVKLENGLYSYPQHLLSSRLIDGMCFWLKNAEIDVVNVSDGPELKNADYIPVANLVDWFMLNRESSS